MESNNGYGGRMPGLRCSFYKSISIWSYMFDMNPKWDRPINKWNIYKMYKNRQQTEQLQSSFV